MPEPTPQLHPPGESLWERRNCDACSRVFWRRWRPDPDADPNPESESDLDLDPDRKRADDPFIAAGGQIGDSRFRIFRESMRALRRASDAGRYDLNERVRVCLDQFEYIADNIERALNPPNDKG